MLDEIIVPEKVLNERYEMNVLYCDDEGQLREMEAGDITANCIVQRVANGIAKLKLTNIKINGKGFTDIIENYKPKLELRIF